MLLFGGEGGGVGLNLIQKCISHCIVSHSLALLKNSIIRDITLKGRLNFVVSTVFEEKIGRVCMAVGGTDCMFTTCIVLKICVLMNRSLFTSAVQEAMIFWGRSWSVWSTPPTPLDRTL